MPNAPAASAAAMRMLDSLMRVRVLLFGPQADAAGRSAVEIDLPEPADCRILGERLAEACPALAPTLPGSRFAVNQEFASPEQQIRPGDELALIGLVSGG